MHVVHAVSGQSISNLMLRNAREGKPAPMDTPVYCYSLPDFTDIVISEIDSIDHELATSMTADPRTKPLIADAWANGWRDARWLAGCTILGIAHPDCSDRFEQAMCNLLRAADVTDPDPDVQGQHR